MEGWLYDGESAARRPVALGDAEDGWRIAFADTGEEAVVTRDLLRHAQSRRDAEIYGRTDLPGWRLGLPIPVDPALLSALPKAQVYGRWIDRFGLARMLVAGAAASATILYFGHKAPDLIAPLVPFSWEQRFGDMLLGDIDARVCRSPDGQKALDTLAARLSPAARAYKVRVADLPLVNAVALPGGNIVIFKGLLIEAKSPDEVAGVLGHEIAHVENRDVTRALIRHYGFGILLSLVGGSTGGNIESLMAARYGRDAEARADDGAIAALRRAAISPRSTGVFFGRLAAAEGEGDIAGAMNYLSSHPMSASRRTKFESATAKGVIYTPALSAEEWRALRTICPAADPERVAPSPENAPDA